jgi:hypothetical protein
MGALSAQALAARSHGAHMGSHGVGAVLERLTEEGSGSGWCAGGCGLAEMRLAASVVDEKVPDSGTSSSLLTCARIP